jgi:hypothetical protein
MLPSIYEITLVPKRRWCIPLIIIEIIDHLNENVCLHRGA